MRGLARTLLLAILLYAPLGAVAEDPPRLTDLALPALSDDGQLDLRQFADRWMLLVLFEPNCSWCLKQLQAADKLRAQRPGEVAVVAVGVHGSRPQLKAWLRKARGAFPAALATPELVAALDGVPATPWTLVSRPGGAFHTHLRGFADPEVLRALLEAGSASDGGEPRASAGKMIDQDAAQW